MRPLNLILFLLFTFGCVLPVSAQRSGNSTNISSQEADAVKDKLLAEEASVNSVFSRVRAVLLKKVPHLKTEDLFMNSSEVTSYLAIFEEDPSYEMDKSSDEARTLVEQLKQEGIGLLSMQGYNDVQLLKYETGFGDKLKQVPYMAFEVEFYFQDNRPAEQRRVVLIQVDGSYKIFAVNLNV